MKRLAMVCVAAAALASMVLPVRAYIDQKFTPGEVVNQSELIVQLKFDGVKDGKATATVVKVLKDTSKKFDAKTITLDLTTAAVKEHSKALEEMIKASGDAPAAMFAKTSGAFQRENAGGEGPAENAGGEGFINFNNTWLHFFESKGVWQFDGQDTKMLGTFQGSTDQLLRAVGVILADAELDLPVNEGVSWTTSEPKNFGKVAGAVGEMRGVDLAGDGVICLYVASDGGDKLFRFDKAGKGLKDITADVGLTAKSRASCWADLNADGKSDLVSSDGSTVKVYVQGSDGKFKDAFTLAKDAIKSDVVGVAVTDTGKAGKAGIVIATSAAPMLWVLDGANAVPPVAIEWVKPDAALGAAGRCIVADLDGDNIPDLMQLFVQGSLVAKGTAAGKFAAPVRCAVALGEPKARVSVGDLDSDGLLDMVTSAGGNLKGGDTPTDTFVGVWQNQGGLKFRDTLPFTGEFAYKHNEDASDIAIGDFNNDGRQDLMMMFHKALPALYFSRGFRTFGCSNGLSLDQNGLLPAGADGQVAGCLADVTGDGADEVLVTVTNGDCWMLSLETSGAAPLGVRAALSGKGGLVGPITVTAWAKQRCLGGWNVTAGGSDAIVGLTKNGPVTLKWQFPGGKQHTKDIVVMDQAARFVIQPDDADKADKAGK